LLEKIVAIWQHGSAISASLLFSALGIPNTQGGIMLSIPGLNLEVAQECSSLRSSLMLIVTSMVLAQLFLAILLAEDCCRSGRDSAFDCQEWGSNLHYLDAWDSR
jgi:hypothetical protein